MARKTIEQYYSDLSGEKIDGPAPTLAFSVDGTRYEVDLTASERAAFEEVLAPYTAAAHTTGRRRTGAAKTSDAKQIRAWAVDQGLSVPTRGRIPATIRDAYEAARRN